MLNPYFYALCLSAWKPYIHGVSKVLEYSWQIYYSTPPHTGRYGPCSQSYISWSKSNKPNLVLNAISRSDGIGKEETLR